MKNNKEVNIMKKTDAKKETVTPQSQTESNVQCFSCRQMGHYARDCKQKRAYQQPITWGESRQRGGNVDRNYERFNYQPNSYRSQPNNGQNYNQRGSQWNGGQRQYDRQQYRGPPRGNYRQRGNTGAGYGFVNQHQEPSREGNQEYRY